jgi:hypothetical protein
MEMLECVNWLGVNLVVLREVSVVCIPVTTKGRLRFTFL